MNPGKRLIVFLLIIPAHGATGCPTSGSALVCFGTLFLANPDLPERFKRIMAGSLNPAEGLNKPDPSTFYGGGEKGYMDYPAFGQKIPT